MNKDYLIVLFKNRVKHKIIKAYQNEGLAQALYGSELRKSNSVIFEIQIQNGKFVNYELGLLKKTTFSTPIYKTDELGRNIPIVLDYPGMAIIKLEPYRFEERLFDIESGTKLGLDSILVKFFSDDGVKLVSKLNNKIIIQSDDSFRLLSAKSDSDAERFLSCLEARLFTNKKTSAIVVRDISSAQKKYLYKMLTEHGFDKSMLYRGSTTHLKDK